jgi:GH15 family glucan-1,4-alpha-glucosidase
MDVTPIEDYALIGDTRTAALCSQMGSIDWLCVPRFDSDPIFGRLVGGERAGSFSITPRDLLSVSRRYRSGSTVLETAWRTRTGELLLTEGMVTDLSSGLLPQMLLVRRVRCTGGRSRVSIAFDPKQGLPGHAPEVSVRNGGLICSWGSLSVSIRSAPPLKLSPGRSTTRDLTNGEDITLVLTLADRAPLVFVEPGSALALLDQTDRWWRDWSRELRYEGAFPDTVVRSLITLRLLTYAPSGAPVAAPTTSLPEAIGEGRNWDYRFSWPRDAAIGLAGFLYAGKKEEAHSFMHWLLHSSRLTRPRLDVLYTLYGKRAPEEREIHDVPGYDGSRPVRVGNAARHQHQLDVYGWVIDAAWLLSRESRLHAETWRAVSGFADFVAETWRAPDAGIWEVRGDPAHYVHSKLMAWLALDRAIRLGRSYHLRTTRLHRWRQEKAAIAKQVRAEGFSGARNTYVRSYGSHELDAALLLLPILEFEESGSPRTVGTIKAIQQELDAGDGLLYRYPPGADGLGGREGAFLACSFWLVQALARVGPLEQAKELFDHLQGYANDAGLFSEEIEPTTKRLLGNHPQALTHATVVQAALAIEDAESARTSRAGSAVG